MSINFNKEMELHAQALKLHAERAKILASNIANENTPGYQARDIDFAASLRNAQAEEVGGLLLDSGESELLYRVPNHASGDGNTVELGSEQAAFAQNAADFQASLTFTNMKIKGLIKAITGV